jgi:Putative auto-transporter adhesin, head GIN domain
MKIKILSLITMLIVLGSAPKTFANNNATLLKETAAISKIEVRGNVELYISDAPSDQIKVYNKYYSESALVQSKNGVLRIASYTNEKLIVWVSSSDLRSVSMYDNSTLKSFGHLSKIEFNVDLHNQAEANLNLDAFAATLTVKDNAKVSMNGATQELSLNYDKQANVKRTAFIVQHLYEARPTFTAAAVENNNALSM